MPIAQRPRVVVPDDAPPVMGPSRAYQNLLQKTEVQYYDSLPGSEEVLIERIRDAGIVINVRSSARFTENVFRNAPHLKLLSIWGTGTDNVDLKAAACAGVTVTNTPGVAAISIAEHALALTLAVARNLNRIDAATRSGEWPRGQMVQLHGKTLGIIGLGAIGRQFARLGQGIGMKVIAWTMHPNPALGFELVEWEELFRRSDVVSLHLRLSEQTRGMIGAHEFQAMKRSAIFINTARGPIVDEVAMMEALSSGCISGAGLDVFEKEPLPSGHPLTQFPNVALTPHCAGITPETLEAGLQLSVDNIWSFLAGKPENVVTAAVSEQAGI